MKLYVEKDYDALSKRAALIFAKQVNAAPLAAFGFATGGTPVGMYEELKKMRARNEIYLDQITAFNLDEYYPIENTNTQSYAYFMAENLFDEVNLPKEKRNIPNGDSSNPTAECVAYDEKINRCGGIEMQILGLGTNGHIGFNEPAEFFSGATVHVELAESTIQSNARFFDDEKDVPRHAITMGIRTILMAKRILLLVSGEAKADILRDALIGPITPNVPASALQLHRDVIVIADEAAAKHL
ncbi:MAG: glucosamine-6-phosphate deaminase [Defluviitaleaceae bacterium]|nr:glucosamine-6-phosphate deaminase [Defluviitaleaceae bacterium]